MAPLAVQVVIEGAQGEVAAFVDDGLELTCTVVVSCVGTFLRRGFVADADPAMSGRWTGVITLDAEELRGKADVVGHVSADMGHRPAPVGAVRPLDAVFRRDRRPFQGTFRLKWSHFSGPNKESAVPAEASSESFFLDLTGDAPAIFLNKDIDGLSELLEGDHGRPDLERALRDAEMRRIVAAAWTSAIGVAAASIRVDQQTGEHELPPSEWLAGVLRWSLPSIFPGAPARGRPEAHPCRSHRRAGSHDPKHDSPSCLSPYEGWRTP